MAERRLCFGDPYGESISAMMQPVSLSVSISLSQREASTASRHPVINRTRTRRCELSKIIGKRKTPMCVCVSLLNSKC
jgi:hypothetical protein